MSVAPRRSSSRSSASRRTAGFWIRRYLPNEIAGTAGALLGAWLGLALSGSLITAAIVGTIGENVGFYGVATIRTARAEWRSAPRGSRRGLVAVTRTALMTAIEYGPAEFIDFFAVRPALLYLGPITTGHTLIGWIVGKLAADVVFYAVAGVSYVVSHPRRGAPGDRVLTSTTRNERVSTLGELITDVDLDALVAEHGTPLLVIDPERVERQYDRLRAALPFVHFHYAIKALAHPAVLETIRDADGYFDVAGDGELDALEQLGVSGSRIIHTQPVKTPAEITRAYVRGVRTFVVDSDDELAKFRDVTRDVRVLVRLAYRNQNAKSDLSTKFGVGPQEAERLVAQADDWGIHIAGFSFHVGSQLAEVEPWRHAVVATLELMERLERSRSRGFEVLDIGGGFPVSHRADVPSFERIAAVLRPLLAPYAERLEILAEPGRIVVADAGTLISRVVGTRQRDGSAWITLDDGVYGGYSAVMTEDVHPVLVARCELDGEIALRPTVIAGPTCDSVDVVARDYPMPTLVDGDLVLSPAMGAYSVVTGTEFNGRRRTQIAVVDRRAAPPIALRPGFAQRLGAIA